MRYTSRYRSPRSWAISFLVTATALLTFVGAASSDETGTCRLWGEVTDGPSAAPIEGALVRVGETFTRSDALGRYELSVARDVPVVLEVYADLPGTTESLHQSDLRFDCDDHYRPIKLMPRSRSDVEELAALGGSGVPLRGPRPKAVDEPEGRTIDLEEVVSTLQNPALAVLPADLPATIAVGRRFATTCSGNPITRIDAIDLETYAAGVVTAEIGVFRALTAGEEASFECFKVFAIAARSYALWWWANNPVGTEWNGQYYNLDDTACNQRYDDGPYPEIILRAVRETAGMVLIDAGTTFEIDKYEYAASCGRNGTLPEHTSVIVPDDIPGVRACTGGGWCGHDNCAAHEDNPNVPGDDRCLVRGICQWGSVERSIRGDGYMSILNGYQPHLEVHTFTPGDVPATSLVGFVRELSVQEGPGVPNAEVVLDTGESTVASADGYYVFDLVSPGFRTISVSAQGYVSTTGTKHVLSGIKNWASIAMTPVEMPADTAVLEPEVDAGPDLGTTADVALDSTLDNTLDSAGVVERTDTTPVIPPSDGSGCCALVKRPTTGDLRLEDHWVWIFFGVVGLSWIRRRR